LVLHGAEHRAIAAAEHRRLGSTWQGLELPSRFSTRCGTNFAALLLPVATLGQRFWPLPTATMTPLVVTALSLAVTMELWQLVQASSHRAARAFLLPGLALQRVTTREPRLDETRIGLPAVTTVLMLTTLLPPTAGTARVAGFDVVKQGPEVRKAIGAALQEAALDPLLTGREHLRLQTAMHGIGGEERKRRSDELLERVGLMEAADRKVNGYSGGMKRRLDLALALVHHPRILFLDEPTTGLDVQSRSALWEEVGRLAKDDGVTVFLTTQYLEEADVLADRVGIIDHGRLVAEGTPESLKAEIACS